MPVLTVNGAVVEPPPTVTDAGRIRPGKPTLVKPTTAPLAGAAFDSVTMQLLTLFGPRMVGLHCSDEITAAAARLTFTLCDVPLYVAVNVPFWSTPSGPVLTVNCPIAPAATVTDAGTLNAGNPLLLNVTTTPLDGTALDSVTVQLLAVLGPSVVGLHCNEEITTAAARLTFTLCDVPLYVAVRVPFWSAPTAPVLTVNGPVVEPAVTVTVAGTVKAGSPLLPSTTDTPLPDAAFDSVTVQLLLAFAPKVVGLHCSDETTVAAARLTFTLCDVPLYVAVNVPFWSVPTAPVLTVNGPVVEPAVTVTVAGTVNAGSPLLPSTTDTPLPDAAFDKVTVQLLVAFAPSVVGLHCSDETAVAAARFTFTLCDVPLYVAVRVPFWSAPIAPVLTVNGPVVEPAVTVTVAGTVNADRPLLLSTTDTPLAPAAFDSVTVQLLLAFAPKVVGVHCREETTVGATRLMVTLCDVPPYDTITDPFWSALNTPVLIGNDAVVAFADTITEDGSVKLFEAPADCVPPEEPLPTVTNAPPCGAGADKVTVQVPPLFGPSVVGVH